MNNEGLGCVGWIMFSFVLMLISGLVVILGLAGM